MSLGGWLLGIGILLFAAGSFFFALAESALFALGRWKARQLATQSSQQAATVLQLLEHPVELLATIVLGNSVSNGSLVILGLTPVLIGKWPLIPTVIGIGILILLGCEVLPKTLAVRSPEVWSLRVARPMVLLQGTAGWFQRQVQRFNERLLRIFVPKHPPGTPVPALTDQEYEELLEMAYQQGTLARSEKKLIMQIITLDKKTAKDVMRPLSQMAAISDDATIEEMVAAAKKFQHRRIPMYDETPDTIVGILNTRGLLLNPQVDLSEVVEFPSFVPEAMNLLVLLRSMQRQHRGMAIVVDEYGGTAGLVTMEDILEAVVGEIRSEGESGGFVFERLGKGQWRVNGTMRLADFRREHSGLPEVPQVETMGGLLVHTLEYVPRAGEYAVVGDLKLTAHSVTERQVRELMVERVGKR